MSIESGRPGIPVPLLPSPAFVPTGPPPAALPGAGVTARRYWDDVGNDWVVSHPDELWRRCSDAIHVWWLERVASDLQGRRILKTDLFDEAFGDGLTAWFEERGNDVVACDLALSTASGAAKKQTSVAAAVADVRRLPFAGSTFDAVFSDSTLDHFHAEDEILQSLRELGRVLRPGGVLLLTMDNPRNPIVWLRNLRPELWRRLGLVPYMVGVTCSARRLEQLLATAGFEVPATGTIMHSPRVLLVPICRWLARRDGRCQPTPRWLDWLRRVESLDRLPLRQLTGHFVAVVARKSS
jgi:SAM-dependent methyltransferase